MIGITNIVASNIPDIGRRVGDGRFRLNVTNGAPHNAAYYFVRYAFRVKHSGSYRIVVQSPSPGASHSSRFSLAFDAGSEVPVLRRQHVSPLASEEMGWHEQDPVNLAAGEHTIEFRFRPEDRMREMNRIDQPYSGHRIEINGLQLQSAEPPEGEKQRRAHAKGGLLLSGGDTVVLFGDSITEENFYGKHLARLTDAIFTNAPVCIYNAGISLNRTWEGLERLDRDALALHPQWVLLALGVNDCMHMTPGEFARNYEQILDRLSKAGIKTICATPSGFCSLPEPDGRWFHTPDRASGFDRTVAYEAREIIRIAGAANQPCADVYGAFTRAGVERKSLMANQWHPNDEGGRMFALALLWAFGATAADIAKSGEPKDTAMWNALAGMPAADYPELNIKPFVRNTKDTSIIVASSFTRNAIYAFSESGRPLACVPVSHHPMGLAWNTVRREIYVACEGSGNIEVISAPGFKLRDPIALGNNAYPVALALSGDGKTLWSANFFGNSLSEIDVVSRAVRRTLPLGACGLGLAVLDGGKTLVALAGDEAIFVNPANASILKRVKVSENPGGFFEDAQGRLTVIDTGRWTLRAVDPTVMRASPAGATPYRSRAVCRMEDGGLLAGDWERGRVVRLSPGCTVPEDIAKR